MCASDRPDISNFVPSNTELKSKGRMIEQLVSTIGGDLINRFPVNSEQDRLKDVSQAEEVAKFIRSKFENRSGSKQSKSIALVDWSSVNRTYNLLCNESDHIDPFVALADFSSILNACIFYDKVVFIGDDQLAREMESRMRLENVFVPLSIDEIGHPMQQLLDAHFSWAFNYFDTANRENAEWLTWLAESWNNLLPQTRFPKHSADAFGTQLGYTTSAERPLWLDMIHRSGYDAWFIDPSNANQLILDNDIRALTYDRLAQTIDAVVGKNSSSFARYVGGCLRSPLQFARAKYADACLTGSIPLESWLLDEWVKKYPAKDKRLEQTVRLPFWVSAIIARCRGDANSLPVEISKCRRQASAFRKKRADLEAALQQTRIEELSDLGHAVSGELDQLSTWVKSGAEMAGQIGGEIVAATLKTQAPYVPPELAKKPIAKMAEALGESGWLRKLALRLFRPHVYFIYTMTQDANQLANILKAAAQILPIGGKNVSEPAKFLSRLGTLRTQWHI